MRRSFLTISALLMLTILSSLFLPACTSQPYSPATTSPTLPSSPSSPAVNNPLPASPLTNATSPSLPPVNITAPSTPQPVLPTITEVVASARPSVAAINVEVTTYDVFNRPVQQSGAGSGWIIRSDGYIVTNDHVIEGATNITVTLDDGRVFPAGKVY